MKAVIMAGGFGTRLKPLTNELPKPMVLMINKPLLEYIVLQLKNNGFTDIAMTLGYKPEVIMDYFGNGKKFGVKIKYYIEETPLGTAGGIKAVSDFIDDDFLVISGDAFSDVDLKDFMERHKNNDAIGSLVLREMDDVTGFGVVKADAKGKIIEFLEKPEKPVEKLVNTGIYAFKKEVLDIIPDGFYDFGRQLFPRLVGQIYGYTTKSYWNDVGTLKAYYTTNLYIVENKEKFPFMFEE